MELAFVLVLDFFGSHSNTLAFYACYHLLKNSKNNIPPTAECDDILECNSSCVNADLSINIVALVS